MNMLYFYPELFPKLHGSDAYSEVIVLEEDSKGCLREMGQETQSPGIWSTIVDHRQVRSPCMKELFFLLGIAQLQVIAVRGPYMFLAVVQFYMLIQ